MLTGSASKGCTRYYHYFPKCSIRFNAKVVNKNFEKPLEQYRIEADVKELYKAAIT